MTANQLKDLENKIDELIALCEALNRENNALKSDVAGWDNERKDLINKNEMARSKIETMIDRLRAMESQV
ncbi:MAG: TIGR02449 family protein [Halioglobus sp.]|nr:TIGR02449 family protein [Halioglobus sp.]